MQETEEDTPPLRWWLACLQGGASAEVRPHGWSLLHITAALGSGKCLKWLLRHKLPVNGMLVLTHIQ